MSTTRSTPEHRYTIVGSNPTDSRGEQRFSVVLLNREARIARADALDALRQQGFEDVLSVEGPAPHYEIEKLSSDFPGARFLLLSENCSLGEQINLALSESVHRHVLVLWSSFRLRHVPADAIERMSKREIVCAVPTFRAQTGEASPTLYAPAFYNRLLRLVPHQPVHDDTPTLFPHGYCGIYDRRRVRFLGGFDSAIPNPYWQKMDFGFRSWMWGERITSLRGFEVSVTREEPAEDATVDESYALFHLKNLAIRFARDSGRLPAVRLARFITAGGAGPVRSIQTFRRVRRWVRENRYRFQQDARRVTELWEVDQ